MVHRVSEMFRGLGCTLVTPNAGEMERLVQLGSASNPKEAKKAKRAVLKVPLEFPKERRAIASR
jgi:DNA-directed RNA polymerase I subunit RPA49